MDRKKVNAQLGQKQHVTVANEFRSGHTQAICSSTDAKGVSSMTPEEYEASNMEWMTYYDLTPEQMDSMRALFARARACIGCGVNCFLIDEAEYRLVDIVWLKAFGDRNAGKACIGCLVRALGRRLTRSDFVPGTYPDGVRSERLRDRLR